MLAELTVDMFFPLLNQRFRLNAEGNETFMELVQVTEGEPRETGDLVRRRPFSLTFSSPLLGPDKNLYLQQSIYRLEHEAVGSLDIFLVPIGPDGNGMGYEAIFN